MLNLICTSSICLIFFLPLSLSVFIYSSPAACLPIFVYGIKKTVLTETGWHWLRWLQAMRGWILILCYCWKHISNLMYSKLRFKSLKKNADNHQKKREKSFQIWHPTLTQKSWGWSVSLLLLIKEWLSTSNISHQTDSISINGKG